ncbi:UNVERIFIED_CONTAM: Phosphatidylinositol 4,5-bisphosphate 5-phosphatase A [Gekko kuhli]
MYRLAGDSELVCRLQEVNSMINKRLKDALFTDQWSELFMEVLSPFNFVLVSTVRMQGVILMVFAKYYHLPFLQDIQTDCTRTGLGGLLVRLKAQKKSENADNRSEQLQTGAHDP